MEERSAISILVDDRERRTGVVEHLHAQSDVEVRIERLPLGDYRVDDVLLFERKTLVDLVASIKDGRLFAQGCRLVGAAPWTAIILEGRGRDLAGCGMHRAAIQGALTTLTLFFGLPLLRSMNERETGQLILLAARQRRRLATGALPRSGRRPRGKPRVQLHVLQGLPGVGPERARRLLEAFGTVEAVMAAPREALGAVAGIGPATAEAIRWAVNEPAPAYWSGEWDARSL
jgi:ERCC4-type nuclease